MANLLARSLMVLALLFGLFFAVGMGVLAYLGMSPVIALVFAIGIIFLQYLIGPWLLELIFKIEWHDPRQIDPELAAFIQRVSQERGIRTPRFGIIRDGNPNAFTFGHYPGDARIVVTTGLLEKLDHQETQAVVAHEIGHIVHWDFVVMTVAAVIPLALYVLYIAVRSRSRGNGAYAIAVAVASYIAYIVSQYVVLLLSRVREFYADQFAAQVTNNPQALSTALVKIAYGLSSHQEREIVIPPTASKKQKKKLQQEQQQQAMKRKRQTVAARGFGIFDGRAAATLMLSGINDTRDRKLSVQSMIRAMQWDLKNPWSLFYELQSTHPMPARRIQALARHAQATGSKTLFASTLGTTMKGYWAMFVEDFIIFAMPWIGGVFGLALGSIMAASGNVVGAVGSAGATVLLFSIGYLLRRMVAYPGNFSQRREVRSLVSEIKVSEVRPIPCVLEGEIIGRGVPGLFFSEDLVLQDESGFIILDYRQPFRIFEVLFGWLRAEKMVGKRGRVIGWYRRTMRPYFELRRIELEDGTVVNSYYYPFTQFLIFMGILIGALMLGVGFFL